MSAIYIGLNYHPFGMMMVGRNWETGSEYRFGFNTQEQDDEVYGNGNLNTAMFWEYDTRLGRRWNRDVIKKPWLSPYATFFNNPIFYSDIKGNVGDPAISSHKTGLDYRGKKDLLNDLIGSSGDVMRPKNNKKEATQSSGPDSPAYPQTEEGKEKVAEYDQLTNKQLGRKMANGFQNPVTGNWKPYSQEVIKYFAKNEGDIWHTVVSPSDNPIGDEWAMLKNGIRDGIFEEYIKKGQPLEQFDISTYINPPDFNYLNNGAFTALIGKSNQVDVILRNIDIVKNANGNVEFTAEVEIIIKDWFGVSEGDFTKYDFASAAAKKALTSFWILQHQRGYKPFINQFHFKETIHGNRTF